jgi:L-ascorbate metabolism protein UlaG (beta-lactamase superfamily)
MNHKRLSPHMIGLAVVLLLLGACGPPEPTSVTLYYEEVAQVELISPQGTRVLIDVFDPAALSSPPTENDILLTTHGHEDHFHQDFVDSFPGQQICIREGEINLPGVTIRGIASAHSAASEIKPGLGNYIFIVDMGGLRIAHFGDIGQEYLTEEQLAALGEVDIAVTQFTNSFSQMTLQNKKGFNLMAQAKPKLIIPTHGGFDMEVIEYAMELWDVFAADANRVTIDRSDLSDETKLLLLGEGAPSSKKIYDLPGW